MRGAPAPWDGWRPFRREETTVPRPALAAVLTAALVLTAAAPASAARAHRAATTFRLTSQLDKASVVETGAPGRSAGDVLVFTERLLDARGRVVGSDAATCTVLFDERSLCTGVYTL